MKKFATFAILSAALFSSQLASAHHVSPPSGSKTGLAAVSKGINLTCVLGLNFVSSSQVHVSLSPGDTNCAALLFNGSNTGYTYNYTYNPTNHQVTVHDLDVTTISIGDCAGDIVGTWNGTAVLVNSTLPAKTAGLPCVVIGSAS